MIPALAIADWANTVGWPNPDQLEQDLTLARLIVEIANDPYLGEELIFRGGTCLHKLHLNPSLRYSEDLDYVRRTAGGIGELLAELRRIGERLNMKVSVDVSKYPKVKFRSPFESGNGTMRIKIEVNTYERSPALPLLRLPYSVKSAWFNGSAEVQTFHPAELVSTKLRAMYQRSKGRDLFDLWLALTRLAIPADEILTSFAPYRPDKYTGALAIANLQLKLQDTIFRRDLDALVSDWPEDYDIDRAAALVIQELLGQID
jgi:predicted nucleotidyltransferase component of viral defense system